MQVEVVDPQSVKFVLPAPKPGLLSHFAISYAQGFQPKHFLGQFHPKHNPDADALAQSLGFENGYAVSAACYGNSDWTDRPKAPERREAGARHPVRHPGHLRQGGRARRAALVRRRGADDVQGGDPGRVPLGPVVQPARCRGLGEGPAADDHRRGANSAHHPPVHGAGRVRADGMERGDAVLLHLHHPRAGRLADACAPHPHPPADRTQPGVRARRAALRRLARPRDPPPPAAELHELHHRRPRDLLPLHGAVGDRAQLHRARAEGAGQLARGAAPGGDQRRRAAELPVALHPGALLHRAGARLRVRDGLRDAADPYSDQHR